MTTIVTVATGDHAAMVKLVDSNDNIVTQEVGPGQRNDFTIHKGGLKLVEVKEAE